MMRFEDYYNERTKREDDFDAARHVTNVHQYVAAEKKVPPLDLGKAQIGDILSYFNQLRHKTPSHIHPSRYAAQVKHVARGSFVPDEDLRHLRRKREVE